MSNLSRITSDHQIINNWRTDTARPALVTICRNFYPALNPAGG